MNLKRLFKIAHSKYYPLLGYDPKNEQLYDTAFTPSGCSSKDRKGNVTNNERLEYLGDAVLESIMSHKLYEKYPTYDEGQLTSTRSLLVKRQTLNILGRNMGLIDYMKGFAHGNVNLLGNCFEALVGAIYLDKGYQFTQQFVLKAFEKHIKFDKLVRQDKNYKSLLLEWCQHNKVILSYELIDQTTLGNNQVRFQVRAVISDKIMGYGVGRNKRQAEQAAAKQAYQTVSRKGLKSIELAQFVTPKMS